MTDIKPLSVPPSPEMIAQARAIVKARAERAPNPPQQATEETHELPPILVRGYNFAKAIARWTLAGMPRSSQAEIDRRLAVCESCKFLVNHYCSKCGCACVEENKIVNKLALETERCPENKW